jgi:hypothetical protein
VSTTSTVAAAVALVGALIAAAFLPARAGGRSPAPVELAEPALA